MKQLAILFVLFASTGCSRKDLWVFNNFENQQKCVVESVNELRQDSSDFFVVKTYNNFGQLTHFTAQVRDEVAMNYLFDYDITYGLNKAVFKGTTKALWWVPDVYPGPDEPVDPNAPMHPEEVPDLSDLRDIEVLLDTKTRYPVEVRYAATGESLLKLKYDHRSFLSQVGNFNVTTDNQGNILSILTPPLVEEEPYYGPQQTGIWYTYSEKELPRGASQYYETPNVFINRMYTILEILNWGPIQPHRERTVLVLQIAYAEEYVPSPFMYMSYSDHQYDGKGNLMSYYIDGDTRRYLPYIELPRLETTRQINWMCRDNWVKK
jgi:hypothetical protein